MKSLVQSRVRGVVRWIRTRRKLVTLVTLPTFLLAVNVPPAVALVADFEHDQLIHSADYTAQYGRWDVIDLPEDLQVNAIHAALLPTGKLLIVAGSGNDQASFDAGTFRTLLYDPAGGQSRLIPTPSDLFCSGHAFLPDGKLLVAGGTQRYEVLDGKVTKAAGGMVVKNENPDKGHAFEKGTEFVAPDGRKYKATTAFTVPPAVKTIIPEGAKVTPSQTTVFVESETDGPAGVTAKAAQYTITGLAGPDANNLYGLAQKLTLDKQDFQGIADTYEFDPVAERYVKVGDMVEKRWYPSLVGLPGGDVLAVSGLDGTGTILPGQNEVFDPSTKRWTERPDLFRYFPTYPALFQTAVPGRLFYSGSNAGYGPADAGRVPGFWNLQGNTFEPVTGLRDPDLMETSGSAFAGPVQGQKVIVVGGGGVGESNRSTTRIDVIDLKASKPTFTPGPDLPAPTRYPNVVQLPNDDLLIANGSRDYRGKGQSDLLLASLYHPSTNTLSRAADPTVGRDYHAEGILMPNGQVMTLGGNALFSDPADTKTAKFEKRLEIYTPPYLFHGPQPVITTAPTEAKLGTSMAVTTPDAGAIAAARLIRPSAATHATDLEQRSVILPVAKGSGGALDLRIPGDPTIVPPGYYMLFLVDKAGVPSVAKWVHVT
ncbi:kelch motif-containing protein [Pseudonocardia sp. 73-21]|uniref:kelch motif-containing protein n=1 Tax=Pseudonocardia sp. 73-21 TaxID=1895809 RepID=UPI000A504472|nr:kelch motif-containing protein [Pseudonocardia sp. 73-21]